MEDEIFNSITNGRIDGKFKIGATGIQWHSKTGGNPLAFKPKDMKSVKWSLTGKTGVLGIDDGEQVIRFSGFREADKDRIESFVRRTLDLELEQETVCSTGLNWGEMKFEHNTLTVVSAGQNKQEYNGHRLLDINLNTVEKATINKNEVLLEFHQDDTEVGRDDEILVEVKFYAPKGLRPVDADEEGVKMLKHTGEEEDGDPESLGVDHMHEMIKTRANISEIGAGDGVASFDQVPIVAPRGRFDIELHEKSSSFSFTNLPQ